MTSESERSGQKDGRKSKIAGDESPKLKKKRIQGPKFHKEIQIRTKNSSLDNTSRRLTLQRAVGMHWW